MGAELPEGFTLDTQETGGADLPSGFTLDVEQPEIISQEPEQQLPGSYEDISKAILSQQDQPEPFEQVAGLKQDIETDTEKPESIKQAASEITQTGKDIASVYPVAETATNILTSSYGVPLSGLAGLFLLPAGLDIAEKGVEAVQKALVYEPKTKAGKRLTESATLPFQQLSKGAEYVGGKIGEAGYPNIAATVHTAIESSPALIGGRLALKKPGISVAKIDKATSMAIKKGINKSVRPSVTKKSTSRQVKKYFKQARVAVEEIIKNKNNLRLVDETGKRIKGLPKSLDQFSQAIEQTRRTIFDEYDSLVKQSDKARQKRKLEYPVKEGEKIAYDVKGKGVAIEKPIKINLDLSAKKLNPVLNNKVLQDLSPETIQYAQLRIEKMKGRKNYTAVETQEAIQLLNQTLEQFYKDPSPEMKGRAFIDSLIANDLRRQLDYAINKTTGKKYGALKSKYGALKTIESDVTKRAIVDARKNTKGLIDFSDIFTGHQIVKGMLLKEPATIAAGGFAKGVSSYYRMLNNPNKIVKNMFSEVEKLSNKRGKRND